MVTLFERKKDLMERQDASELRMDPAYRAWLASKPSPGEVFVDTGEASAADSRKLRWAPSREQIELVKTALDHELALVNELYEEGAHESYAEHVGGLVDDALLEAGVDPVTLKPLAKGESYRRRGSKG